jgi:hypothetical protein
MSCSQSSSKEDAADTGNDQTDDSLPDIKFDSFDFASDQKDSADIKDSAPESFEAEQKTDSSDAELSINEDISSDDSVQPEDIEEEDFFEPYDTGPGTPKITAIPAMMDFGYLQYGDKLQLPVTIKNDGDGTLIIDKIVYLGGQEFQIDPSVPGVKKSETKIEYKFSPKKELLPQETFVVKATFSPLAQKEASATMTVYSNDPSYTSGYKVTFLGNKKMPCVSLSKNTIDFGTQTIGQVLSETVTISSCSSLELEIYEISLLNKGGNNFLIDFSQFPDKKPPSEESPVKLGVGKSVNLIVKLTATAPSLFDNEGKPVPWEDEIKIVSNTFVGNDFVELSGTVLEKKCSYPVIFSQQPDTIEAGTLIWLTAEKSYSPFGDISTYSWAVEQPANSKAEFLPAANLLKAGIAPFFEGKYKVKLSVADSKGNASCSEAVKEFNVTYKEGMFIELMWKTPGDTNLSDSGPGAGADLDLHYLHPKTTNWYDQKLDCYWYTASFSPTGKCEWGSPSPFVFDDPFLLSNSDDGNAPEIIYQLECEWMWKDPYKIGVHYWDAYGHGNSNATLRIYRNGILLFDSGIKNLAQKDLWLYAKVYCDPFKIEIVNSVTPNFQGI